MPTWSGLQIQIAESGSYHLILDAYLIGLTNSMTENGFYLLIIWMPTWLNLDINGPKVQQKLKIKTK